MNTRLLRVSSVWLSFLAFLFVYLSIRWPWSHDAQVFHYIIFLLRHGFAPYRQITDINLPGSYLQEWLGLVMFGGSDVGWRLYDLAILAGIVLCCMYITRPKGWAVGFASGLLFALTHGADGPWYLGERDLFMAFLVLLGYALAFFAVRRLRPSGLFLSSLAFGFACTIKPTVLPLAILVLAVGAYRIKKSGQGLTKPVVAASAGLLISAAAVILFLERTGSFGSFVQSFLSISVFYQKLPKPPFAYLVRHCVPLPLIPFLLFGFVIRIYRKSIGGWEENLLLLGALFCFWTYFFQGKGYVYHRYPFLALILVWVLLQCAEAVASIGPVNGIGFLAICFGVFLAGPYFVWLTARQRQGSDHKSWNHTTEDMMESLSKFDRSDLDGRVQCLDTDAGCYSALFRLSLVQSTGEMGDHLLFWSRPDPVVTKLRSNFFHKVEANPPRVFLLSNKWFEFGQSFDLLDTWPEFKQWLNANYNMTQEVSYPISPEDAFPLAYRVYTAKQVPQRARSK